MDEQTKKLVATVLANTDLFQGIPMPHSLLQCHTVEKGQPITNINGNAIVCILRGQVDIYTTALDGNDVHLSVSGRGDYFGISNLFAKHDLQTQLKAKTATQLVYIPREVFVQLMRTHPDLAVRYATICNEKIQFLLDRISHLTIQSARQKVGLFLLSRSQNGSSTLPPREKLASYLGISRASLFRELSFFKQQGMIQIDGNLLTILNASLLQKFYL